MDKPALVGRGPVATSCRVVGLGNGGEGMTIGLIRRDN
jgi:hypothetical protein